MGLKRTDEFRQDAVRIALTSGLTRKQVASDLGVGLTLAHIKEQSRLSLGSYGRPRMTEELKEIGLDVGHRRVGRLMRQNGISVVRTRKHKVTTDSNHKFNIAPNLLDRNFTADQPNQKWAGDISYVWTREGWLYLAVILDLHSRRVVGWAPLGIMLRITLPGSGQQSDETRPGNQSVEHGHCLQGTAQRLHSSYGSWQPILLARLSENPAPPWLRGIPSRACKQTLPGSG